MKILFLDGNFVSLQLNLKDGRYKQAEHENELGKQGDGNRMWYVSIFNCFASLYKLRLI